MSPLFLLLLSGSTFAQIIFDDGGSGGESIENYYDESTGFVAWGELFLHYDLVITKNNNIASLPNESTDSTYNDNPQEFKVLQCVTII